MWRCFLESTNDFKWLWSWSRSFLWQQGFFNQILCSTGGTCDDSYDLDILLNCASSWTQDLIKESLLSPEASRSAPQSFKIVCRFKEAPSHQLFCRKLSAETITGCYECWSVNQAVKGLHNPELNDILLFLIDIFNRQRQVGPMGKDLPARKWLKNRIFDRCQNEK